MSELTETERKILAFMDEGIEFETRDAAIAAYHGLYDVSPRKYSAKAREALLNLLERGYVDVGTEKAGRWIRTPAGTEALKEAENA